jgi:hypothetical protein
MTKFNKLPNSVNRARRILGRIINRKELPQFVYRFDTRPPSTIRVTGFQPWNGTGNVSMMEHVNNSYDIGHAKASMPTKHDSQWVSTGAYGLLKKIDPTFAQQLLNTNLYKINATVAMTTGSFMDANDHFDRAGVNRPYSTQREWIKNGGVNQNAIIEYMSGKDFALQIGAGGIAPDEELLTGWQAF